jgi:hypothetical protein
MLRKNNNTSGVIPGKLAIASATGIQELDASGCPFSWECDEQSKRSLMLY